MLIRRRIVASCSVLLSLSLLAGCQFTGALTKVDGDKTSSDSTTTVEQPDNFKSFIRGKKTSSLSDDRKTITLSIEAVDPNGGEVRVDWSQDKNFGTFNTTRGKDVQWTATRDGDFTVVLTATVKDVQGEKEPDVANFLIPVADGKIKATEIAPEITVAPQSLVLFRTLPATLQQSDDQLSSLGVRTKAQLTATSYIYDATTNTKVKQSGDFNEIKWLSGDASIVTVDDSGLVRPADGSAVGRTIVTATSKTNAAGKAGSLVSVQYLDTQINLSYPTTTIYLNGQGSPNNVTIGATVQYSNPVDRNRIIFTDPNGREITWSSSNPSIAQVDMNGKVSPLADAATGDVVITATSNYDPTKNSSVTIKVRGNTTQNVNLIAK